MVWGKAGSTTLSTAGDDLDITSMTANKFNQIILHHIGTGNMNILGTFNNDSGNRYCPRTSDNGGTDYTTTGITEFGIYRSSSNGHDTFNIINCCFISGEEKLIIVDTTDNNGNGSNIPNRAEGVHKYVPSDLTDTITRIDTHNTTSGSYDTGSNISALGSDMTPAGATSATVQDGAIFEETDTNKHYLLDDGVWTEI